MKTDPNWKPPEGFKPSFLYPDGVTGVPIVGYCKYERKGNRDLEFFVGGSHSETPALPFKLIGQVDHLGWDIPTRFVIDAVDHCYVDNAHGGELTHRTKQYLLNIVKDNEYCKDEIRKTLGMKPEMPSWMKKALKANWTPPAEFNKSDYD